MQHALKVEIKRISKRVLSKEKSTLEAEEKYREQYEKRTGLPASLPKTVLPKPKHRHFNPIYCSRNANFLAKTIWHKVLTESYEPLPAIEYLIPKADGSKRAIMAFSIPDAALANILMKRVQERNRKRLSPYSYAYHPDKNLFDAIIALKEYEADGKLFAVQIDFEKYFDSIPRWYLEKKIDDKNQISLTPHERFAFKAFMSHRFSPLDRAVTGPYAKRVKGTPQGSSVSLILANLANHDLDTRLAASPGKFVRFADDVVALCSSYEHALHIERCFMDHCKTSGLVINSKKSPGISIIADTTQEMRTSAGFDYLGYCFKGSNLTMPEKKINHFKNRISRLINLYLIHYLDLGFDRSRSGVYPNTFDWDLLGLIYEMRRSLYGGLSEQDIKLFLERGIRLPNMKGTMGFYCLLDDPTPLKHLDGWMLSAVRRAMAARKRILATKYSAACPTPNNGQLATGSWLSLSAWRGTDFPEPRMPSLVRGWRAARKHYFTFGLENVEAPGYGHYSGISGSLGY